MPSVGFLFPLPFIFSFTHMKEEKLFLVNLFAYLVAYLLNPNATGVSWVDAAL